MSDDAAHGSTPGPVDDTPDRIVSALGAMFASSART